MSKMLAKMNLISAVQQLPEEDIKTIQGYIEMIEKENQKLKEKVDKYENPEDMTLMMMWCTEKVKDENKELKKQLEDYIKSNMKLKEELSNKRKEYQDTYKDVRIEIKEYKTQQKEFIKYLEDEIENSTFLKPSLKMILQKYKEIIGVSDENNIK